MTSFGAVRFKARYVAGYFRYFAADESYGNSASPTNLHDAVSRRAATDKNSCLVVECRRQLLAVPLHLVVVDPKRRIFLLQDVRNALHRGE